MTHILKAKARASGQMSRNCTQFKLHSHEILKHHLNRPFETK
jgi:hypothetical protein